MKRAHDLHGFHDCIYAFSRYSLYDIEGTNIGRWLADRWQPWSN